METVRTKNINEECGVYGIYGHDDAAILAYHGLYALQHRGQESAGIVSSDGVHCYKKLGMGLVSDIFSDEAVLTHLKGNLAIGHNRYSTTGSSVEANIQPIMAKLKEGTIAIGHNGNLVNTISLRNQLIEEGAIFQTTTDTELIIHLIARSKKKTLIDKILDTLPKLQGAYSVTMLTEDSVIAARDPHGFRPLCVGKVNGAHVFASESCAFDISGAEYIRDVNPGEVLVADSEGLHSYYLDVEPTPHFCIFEYVYFSRPDSRVFGEFVDKTRRKLGKKLAEECGPEDASITISVPDSSNTAALGYSSKTKKRFEIGLIRNHYIGRTFIQPAQNERDFSVKVKYNTVGGVLNKRSIVVVEDSIVRGTTLKKLTKLLRDAGTKKVHVRVSSPPIRFPCYYGMDFPTKEELIANQMTVDEIRDYLGVDSLHYLSLEGMISATGIEPSNFCTACFSGNYPIEVDEGLNKNSCEEPDEN